MTCLTLTQLGWQPFFERQWEAQHTSEALPARVSAHFGGHLLLLSGEGELNVPCTLLEAAASRQEGNIAVGDWFLIDRDDHRGLLQFKRKSLLSRKAAGPEVKPQPIAANVDTAFIVSSCNRDFNLSRIERYLALVLNSRCTPVVVLTKADLCDDPRELAQQVRALHRGVIVEAMDARDATQSAVLDSWCQTGKTSAMLGSSGVGKSTLAVTLGAGHLATQSIRAADDKGRHTTTARSMHRLQAGGWLIDNPGMREFQLPACEDGLSELFDDVLQYADRCRFRNCNHDGDDGCAIEQAVQNGLLDRRRLTNYRKLQSEQERNAESLANRRRKEKNQGRMYKRVISGKRKLRDLR